MEISKATYQKFRAADKSYALFFDSWEHSSETVGFCSMMRTIYFWRPAIAVVRVLSMVTVAAIVCFAFVIKSTEIIAGVVVLALLALLGWLVSLVIVANEGFFETREKPLLLQWAKASHDKVCPLIPLGGFLAEEHAARIAAREEATCEE